MNWWRILPENNILDTSFLFNETYDVSRNIKTRRRANVSFLFLGRQCLQKKINCYHLSLSLFLPQPFKPLQWQHDLNQRSWGHVEALHWHVWVWQWDTYYLTIFIASTPMFLEIATSEFITTLLSFELQHSCHGFNEPHRIPSFLNIL